MVETLEQVDAPRGAHPSVVVNGRFLAKPMGGVSRVGVELLRALAVELDLGADVCVANPVRRSAPDSQPLNRLRSGIGFASQLGEQLGLPLMYPGATVLSFCNSTPMLAYDSVIWLHDTHIFDVPETYRTVYRMWHRTMLAMVKLRRFRVVTVSTFAAECLIKRGVPRERLRVIHNGGDHILREAEDIGILESVSPGGRPYVLVVGSPATHKNVDFAINALLARRDEIRVAVVGLTQSGPYAGGRRQSDGERLVVLPRISDAALRALYHHACAVVSPSLCEGFGLYAAEAMFAESGPLVLSDRGAHPEVGGNAALYFDPTDPSSLDVALTQALRPPIREQLCAAARVQREKFRWRRAARQVIEYYLSWPGHARGTD